MRNLSNLLAVFALVTMMGLLVGCGCTTSNTPDQEDMVNTGEETLPPAATEETVPHGGNTDNLTNDTESIVDDNGNLIDDNGIHGDVNNSVSGNTAHDGITNQTTNDGETILDDAGNVVGDVIEGAGDAVEDAGRGVKNMTNDAVR